MLIGLAAKNAILIANREMLHEQGQGSRRIGLESAKLRFRRS